MLIKIAMVLVLISALFFPGKYAFNDNTMSQVKHIPFTWLGWIKSLGISLIAVSFTYGGYQQSINFGNDIDRPARNLPRGIFIGIVAIIVLYLLVNLSYYNIVGFERMKGEREIAFVVMERIFGNTGAIVFSALLFIGVLAYVNGLLLSNPRVMYAMGDDGSLPGVFARQNKNSGVLTFSLTVFTILCVIILFFAQQFEKILTFTIFLDCFGMVLSSATIFWFRSKTKHLDGTGIYKMKLFPLMPLVFMGAYLFVGISISMADPAAALTGSIVLAVFVVLYFLMAKMKKNISKPLNQ
jgi:basic amino acid/polyamine antiporter, APA family